MSSESPDAAGAHGAVTGVSSAAGSPFDFRLPSRRFEMSAVSMASPLPYRFAFPDTCGNGLLPRSVAKSNMRLVLGYPIPPRRLVVLRRTR
jgi:hypothetical protein